MMKKKKYKQIQNKKNMKKNKIRLNHLYDHNIYISTKINNTMINIIIYTL